MVKKGNDKKKTLLHSLINLHTEWVFPHVFETGLHESLPRDRVLLAGTAVVYYHTFTPAIKQIIKNLYNKTILLDIYFYNHLKIFQKLQVESSLFLCSSLDFLF